MYQKIVNVIMHDVRVCINDINSTFNTSNFHHSYVVKYNYSKLSSTSF